MADAPYIIYTYQTSESAIVCHAYGPTTEGNANLTAQNLKQSNTDLTFTVMVLPLEPVPV